MYTKGANGLPVQSSCGAGSVPVKHENPSTKYDGISLKLTFPNPGIDAKGSKRMEKTKPNTAPKLLTTKISRFKSSCLRKICSLRTNAKAVGATDDTYIAAYNRSLKDDSFDDSKVGINVKTLPQMTMSMELS